MLASRNRLTESGQFHETVRRGQRAGGPLLVVHLLGRTDVPAQAPAAQQPPRIGFVVSRAVGPAVTRNQVKRRLRHLSRELLTRVPDGSLVVIRAHPAAATASSPELRAELDRCLARALKKVGAEAKAGVQR